MNKKLIWLAVVLSITFFGCVQIPSVHETRAEQLAVSSVQDVPIEYEKGALFNVEPRYIEQFEQLEITKQSGLTTFYSHYEKAIIHELEAKGYVYTNDLNADFSVKYGLALGEDFTDDQLSQELGVVPGLNATEGLAKGSFIIYIQDSAMEKRVWRGAVQGFVHDSYSEEERIERVTKVVSMVLRNALTHK
jgi:uncharacterized protein DUF4136